MYYNCFSNVTKLIIDCVIIDLNEATQFKVIIIYSEINEQHNNN